MEKCRFQTKCNECGKILQKNGIRYHSCIFDSDFPTKPMTKFRVYGHCNECYKKMRGSRDA